MTTAVPTAVRRAVKNAMRITLEAFMARRA
jgi:hypothetical protein